MFTSQFLKNKISDLKKEIQLLKKVKKEEDYFLEKSQETITRRNKQLKEAKNSSFDTVALWGLYNQEDMKTFKSLTLPLFMSTTGGPFESLIDGSLLLSYKTIDDPNKAYTRIDNNNTDHLALKLAALEGLGIPELTQGFCTSSGMSAIMMATMPFLEAGDNFVSSNRVYGGTQQLFSITYPKSAWQVLWVDQPWILSDWEETSFPSLVVMMANGKRPST